MLYFYLHGVFEVLHPSVCCQFSSNKLVWKKKSLSSIFKVNVVLQFIPQKMASYVFILIYFVVIRRFKVDMPGFSGSAHYL